MTKTPASHVPEELSRNLERIGVSLAYGEKIDLGSSSIVPVAVVGLGFGAGEGEDPRAGAEGANVSGGGGSAVPVGAYVSDEFGTRFEPNVIALLVAATPIAFAVAWGLPKLVRAFKKRR
ncbi:MAG: hypothetical protein Q4E05_03965 [Pseudoclavibacter sp.]|nr:hypothetical protein [Pseudoclavibacter sp.]